MTQIEAFSTRDAMADAAADAIAAALGRPGALVAAGGSTPGPVYDRLARFDLSWPEVTVTLTDERWVDAASAESNERMIRGRLLTAQAAGARFLPLKGDAPTLEAGADADDEALRHLGRTTVVLLGMGADGHVASLFPGAPELAVGLDLESERRCLAVRRAGLEPFVPRLTLTARALLDTNLLILLVSGADKRVVIDRVAADPAYAPPVATILRQTRTPVRVLWSA
jgi:6-phosphogluconolactonase